MNNNSITVVGMGYVGLPLAAALSDHFEVYGYDISKTRIDELKNGFDRNEEAHEFGRINFNTDLSKCNSDVYIIAVPTPILAGSIHPDLDCLEKASAAVGRVLKAGDLVVYESTVYPGTITQVCIPILEKFSNLKSPDEFSVGYSPERINPGDTRHTVDKIDKIVSGQNAEIAIRVGKIYTPILKGAKVWAVSNIETAEMAKLIENCQRDVNIAFMNEVAELCGKLNLETSEVLAAANTKWNFIPFEPGLVGGHCIPVDPYYFIHVAGRVGSDSRLMAASRYVNSNVPKLITEKVMQNLWQRKVPLKDATILVLGLSFKENCKDTRNSQSFEILDILRSNGACVVGYDPIVGEGTAVPLNSLGTFDSIIIAVKHECFVNIPVSTFRMLSKGVPHLFDIKNIYNKQLFEQHGVKVWQM